MTQNADAADLYREYLALKAHFSGSYDYQKYNGKIRASADSASFRRDRYAYLKLAKHPDPHRLLLANISIDNKAYIRNLAYDKEAEQTYIEFVAKMESLSYRFKQDLKKLEGSLKSNLLELAKHSYCNHPKIIVLYLSKEIMFETLCIIASETGMLKRWEKMYPYDSMIEHVSFQMRKYTPFINYDKSKYRKYIADEFRDRD